MGITGTNSELLFYFFNIFSCQGNLTCSSSHVHMYFSDGGGYFIRLFSQCFNIAANGNYKTIHGIPDPIPHRA